MVKFVNSLAGLSLAVVVCQAEVEYETYNGTIYPVYVSAQGYDPAQSLLRNSQDVKVMLFQLMCGQQNDCRLSRQFFIDLLTNYGCNCYPTSHEAISAIDPNNSWLHMAYKGQPIDELDQACLDVYNSYKCMFMDHEAGRINQIGKYGCYKGMTFRWHFDTNGEIQCGRPSNLNYYNTEDDCRLAACQIEKNFVYKVQNFLNSQGGAENFYNNNQNNYGYCPNVKRNGKVRTERDSCCGEFPNRVPFNSLYRECCEDGSMASIGGCL